MNQTDSCRISPEDFNNQVRWCRVVAIVIFAFALLNFNYFNLAIDILWREHLFTSSIFRHDSFEPTLSSICFVINMLTWIAIDYYIPHLHKYRIQPSDDNRSWKGRESAYVNEAAWYLLPWLIFDAFFPRRNLPYHAPTFFKILIDIILSLMVYDALFFTGHLIIHKTKYLYRTVHEKHHMFHTIRAGDAVRHTFIDGTWDVLCSVIALNIVQAHPISRSLYDIVAITLLCEIHSGMDFPWMLHNLIPFHIMGGSVAHDIHHRKGYVNFQQFFTYFDYIAGTLELNKEYSFRTE